MNDYTEQMNPMAEIDKMTVEHLRAELAASQKLASELEEVGVMHATRIRKLERQLAERDAEIKRLKAELDAAKEKA